MKEKPRVLKSFKEFRPEVDVNIIRGLFKFIIKEYNIKYYRILPTDNEYRFRISFENGYLIEAVFDIWDPQFAFHHKQENSVSLILKPDDEEKFEDIFKYLISVDFCERIEIMSKKDYFPNEEFVYRIKYKIPIKNLPLKQEVKDYYDIQKTGSKFGI